MNDVLMILGMIGIAIGTFFVFVGSLGVARFEDVYLRLQASSKSLTFGLVFFLPGIALMIQDVDVLGKAILAIAFQFLTAPIAANVIARAAIRRGQRPMKTDGAEATEA